MVNIGYYLRHRLVQGTFLFVFATLVSVFLPMLISPVWGQSPSCCVTAGDSNDDGTVNLEDLMYLIRYTFQGGPAPSCREQADVTGNGSLNLEDIMFLVARIFQGGPAPVCPNANSGGPPSEALIDSALADGTIDYETSLIYRVYAAFNDPRLPGQFQGDDSQVRESNVLQEITRSWDTLSTATQDIIGPYVVNPIYEGSWANQPPTGARTGSVCLAWKESCAVDPKWVYVDTRNGKGRIWYNVDDSALSAPKAQLLADAFDNDIYPKLTSLMGATPVSDAGFRNNGGDGRLDIVLLTTGMDADDEGVSTFLPGNGKSCTNRPAFIEINAALSSGTELMATLAHEFMHVLLFTFPGDCHYNEYAWMHEATATWAEHYVYSNYNTEQVYADDYLQNTRKSLDWDSKYSGLFEYGTYLFFFYLQQFSPNWIPAIWNASAAPNSFQAIDNGLQAAGSTNLAERWPEFARRNWNVAPLDKYNQWDGLTSSAAADSVKVKLDGGTEDVLYLNAYQLVELSAQYFYFSFPDDNVSTVKLVNGLKYHVEEATNSDGIAYYKPMAMPAEDTKGLNVQLLLKIAGQDWTNMDVTDYSEVMFQRDRIAGRVEEMVVIVSNSSVTSSVIDPVGEGLLLYVSNVGSWKWHGEVKVVDTVCGTYTLTANVDWTNQLAPIMLLPPQYVDEYAALSSGVPFVPSSGTFTWTLTGSCGDCSVSGSQSWPVSVGPLFQSNMIFLYPGAFDGTYYRGVDLLGLSPGPFATANEHWVCPDDTYDEPNSFISLDADTQAPDKKLHLSASGRTITGTYDNGLGTTTTVNLTAVRQ